jgi:M6 family metalloprotease-like protein
MHTHFSFRRISVSLLALIGVLGVGGGSARAAGEFCLIPPQATSPVRASYLNATWKALWQKHQDKSRAFSIPLAATEPQPLPPPSTGRLDALVILADFEDVPAQRPNLEMRNLFFGSKQDAPDGSVHQYYLENSYGKLDYNGIVFGDPNPSPTDSPDPTLQVKWVRMPHGYSWYANNAFGFGPAPRNAQQLVADALQGVKDLYPLLNWSQFDHNNDGFIDLLYIVHAGPGAEGSSDPTQIWSHRSDLETDFVVSDTSASGGPLKARAYAMGSETSGVGVHAHESGHVLGLPDLYTNPQGQSVGLGDWSIMASGSNVPILGVVGLDWQRPAHFDPWCKIQLGWITPTVISKSAKGIALPPVQTNPVVLKILANPINPLEYYLVENRAALEGTYDAPFDFGDVVVGGLHGTGVMIYHVDEARGSNDDRGHLLVSVEEADQADKDSAGREKGASLLLPEGLPQSNPGDAGDPFGIAHHDFTNTTNPSTINYDGQDSGVRITNINAPAGTKVKVAGGYSEEDAQRPVVPANQANATLDVTVASLVANVFTSTGIRRPTYNVRLLNTTGQVVDTATVTITGGQFVITDLDQGDYILEVTATGFIPQLISFHKGEGIVSQRIFLVPQPSASSVTLGWNLLSFPFDFNGATVSQVLGAPGITNYGWDGANYVADPPVVAGQSYWIYITDAKQYQIAIPGFPISPEKIREIPVKAGWNLIGDPYPAGFLWNPSQITLKTNDGNLYSLDQAKAQGIARNTIWLYDAATNSYKLVQRGDPVLATQGFWYFSNAAGSLIIPAPSSSSFGG